MSGFSINKTDENYIKIKKDLTIYPIINNDIQKNITGITNYVEKNNRYIIPTQYGIDNYGIDNYTEGEYKEIECNFEGNLREEQLIPYDRMLNHIKTNKRGIFCASTGVGKTIMALKLISDLKVKTLIISSATSQIELMNQWEEQIKLFLSQYNSIGKIQGKNIEYKNNDIVVSTIKSISQDKYNSNTFKDFGLVIIDECFTYNQKVKTDRGYLKIGEIYKLIKKGETELYALSYNETRRITEYRKIINTLKKETPRLISITLDNDKIVNCTTNHKFLILDMETYTYKWKYAISLSLNDRFYCPETLTTIGMKSKIELSFLQEDAYDYCDFYYKESCVVYDIEVDHNHNYILDSGILAHNCHHISSSKNSKSLFKLRKINYMLGLSATPDRPDGLSVILKQWVGDTFYKFEKPKQGLSPKIMIYRLTTDKYREHFINIMGKEQICFSKMITDIINLKERNKFIVSILFEILKKEKDRQVLVVTERIEHVNILYNLIKEIDSLFTFSKYIGTKMKSEEKKEAMKSQVIIATLQSFGEGIDKPSLDTLLLTTPKKHTVENKKKGTSSSISFVQLVGRIFRKKHTEINPLIVDFFDNFSIFKNQGYSRKKYYDKELKPIQTINHIYNLDNGKYKKEETMETSLYELTEEKKRGDYDECLL